MKRLLILAVLTFLQGCSPNSKCVLFGTNCKTVQPSNTVKQKTFSNKYNKEPMSPSGALREGVFILKDFYEKGTLLECFNSNLSFATSARNGLFNSVNYCTNALKSQSNSEKIIAYKCLAVAHKALGDKTGATDDLKKALKIRKTAELYLMLGEITNSKKYYNKALIIGNPIEKTKARIAIKNHYSSTSKADTHHSMNTYGQSGLKARDPKIYRSSPGNRFGSPKQKPKRKLDIKKSGCFTMNGKKICNQY